MAGACDSHLHIVGDPARYPLDQARTYTPGPASVAQLQAVAGPLGIDRFVIVQPSFYGTDNSLLLDSLDALDGSGRGVAVIDPARIGATELDAMARRGVRGLRINLYSTRADRPGVALAETFGRQAEVARQQGWHVQVIAPMAVLVEAAAILGASPVPVVVDHYGLPGNVTPDSELGRAFLDLVRLPHVWVKLSAPYRSAGDLEIRPDAGWLAAILGSAPDRCLWGSDWPHTPAHALQHDPDQIVPYRALDYGAVLAAFRAALPDEATATRILTDNPARLYGFPA